MHLLQLVVLKKCTFFANSESLHLLQNKKERKLRKNARERIYHAGESRKIAENT